MFARTTFPLPARDEWGEGEERVAAGDALVGRVPTVITIGENCWIGARAVLLSGTQIRDNAIIGAAAVVDFVVPAYAIVAGNPGRIVGWTKESPRQ